MRGADRARGLIKANAALVVIVLVAIAARCWWLVTHTYSIENDGAEYARIAANLGAGHGYVGLQGGPELLFPPLYPFLIDAFRPFSGSYELAGRLVSLVGGLVLVVVIYLIGTRVRSRRAGLIAAAIAAIHPLLLTYSVSVYSEGTSLTLVVLSAYLFLVAADKVSWRYGIAAGVCFGLAGLVRPEAFIYLALDVAVLLVVAFFLRRSDSGWRGRVGVAAIAIAAFAVVVAPYVAWTSVKVGSFRLDGKASVTAEINERMADGQSYNEATSGINAQLQPVGVLLVPNQYIEHPGHVALTEQIKEVAHDVPPDVHQVGGWVLHNKHVTGPVVALLAAIGVVAAAIDPRRRRTLLLLLPLAGAMAIFSATKWFQFRFLLPFLPWVLILAATGVDACISWLSTAAARLTGQVGSSKLSKRNAVLGSVSVLAAVITLATVGLWFRQTSTGDYAEAGVRGTVTADAKQVGEWMAAHGDTGGSVMAAETAAPYYSHASTWTPIGYSTDPALPAEYVDKVAPTYLVLSNEPGEPTVPTISTDANYHLEHTFQFATETIWLYKR